MLNRLIATSPTWFTLPIRLALAAVMIALLIGRAIGNLRDLAKQEPAASRR